VPQAAKHTETQIRTLRITSVALDGNPEPDISCKKMLQRLKKILSLPVPFGVQWSMQLASLFLDFKSEYPDFRKFFLSERRFETSIHVNSQTLVSVCPLLGPVSVNEEDAHGPDSPTRE
jgi:hypothetical protein